MNKYIHTYTQIKINKHNKVKVNKYIRKQMQNKEKYTIK